MLTSAARTSAWLLAPLDPTNPSRASNQAEVQVSEVIEDGNSVMKDAELTHGEGAAFM